MAESSPLQATITAGRIEVRNATPGGEVILFTASLAQNRGVLFRKSAVERLVDDDRNSVVAHVPQAPLPLRTVCVAVDLESGRAVIATPEGYDARRVDFPARLHKKDAEGLLGYMDLERVSAEMLVVRPKKGAWRLRASEGGAEDGDRSNDGKLTLLHEEALPVGASGAAPKHLKKGDVVAVIDGGRLDVFVTEIGK